MSKSSKKLINLNKNEYIDRSIEETIKFPELNILLQTIDSVLLLLEAKEESVLLNTLKHLVEYVRRSNESVAVLREKNLLEMLLKKQFYQGHASVLVKRLSLYLASFLMENMNCLVDLETNRLREIICLVLGFYLEEDDEFCGEYLSDIINKCLDDPQCVGLVLKDSPFILKYFSTIAATTNPDVLKHSLEIMHKILVLQSGDPAKLNFINLTAFPADRLLCELNCEYFEIRKAALKVLQTLLVEVSSENHHLHHNSWSTLVLEQLTKMFCTSLIPQEVNLLVEVLSAALEYDYNVSLFFELNLFDEYVAHLNDGLIRESLEICQALRVLVSCAKCSTYLKRLVAADVTEKLLECLFSGGPPNPSKHILLGLNRLIKSPLAAKRIVDAFDRNLLNKLLELLALKEADIKAREQSANLLENLLSYAFHKTAKGILQLNLPSVMAQVFAQNPNERSIDLLLPLINIIEMMAANTDYRVAISGCQLLILNMGILLKNSFATGILVANLFRCLCCLVNEVETHDQLLKCSLCSSIKRALQSPSNQIKTAATNFIMQTTRFSKFMAAYQESAVLDVLLFNQKHAFCVPTWTPAIESILSKNLTMKFCIRSSLGFSDITAGSDYMISKRKFRDFRVFQCILKEDVSPLHPVIVVNFKRPKNPEHLVVKVVASCYDKLHSAFAGEQEWCYCRSPGDEYLPKYLEQLHSLLQTQNLSAASSKTQKGIDFENLAKRAKVIAQVVQQALSNNLSLIDLNTNEECSNLVVKRHLRELCQELHCSFIPLGRIRTGCKFERAILFKALADQIGVPCTLQRSVDGLVLFNELPLPVALETGVHCDESTMAAFIPWRMLRPTHIVDLMHNVGELYPLQSRQALQYLRLH